MKLWVKKLRGVLGSGALWGIVWATVGGLLTTILAPGRFGLWRAFTDAAMAFGLFGAVAGASFGVLMISTQGRRTLADVSLWGVAAIGLVGGFLAPGVFGLLGMLQAPLASFLTLGVVTGIAGSGLATSIVALAKRSPTGLEAATPIPEVESETSTSSSVHVEGKFDRGTV